MYNLLWDLRYGARSLGRSPGFSGTIVLTLALGIGASSTVFTFVNAVLLRPLPWKDANRIVFVSSTSPGKSTLSESVSFPDFLDWQEQNRVFEQMVATRPYEWNITADGEPEKYHGLYVTSGISRLTGVAPVIGRDFLPGEERRGGERVAIILHGLWEHRYGGDPRIVGKKILLNEVPHTVVGVMPSGFRFWERQSQILSPLQSLDRSRAGSRRARAFNVWARLKPGVTVQQAEREMNVIARRLAEQYPDTNKGWGVRVMQASEYTSGAIRPKLLLLLGAVGFVLLIACANVASLLLARAAARDKEVAVWLALGAEGRHIFSRMLAECLLLAGLGGAAGLALAYAGVRFLVARLPEPTGRGGSMLQLDFIGLDGWVLGFALVVSLLTALLIGIAPAWHASRCRLNETLKDIGTSLTGGPHGRRKHAALVVSEVAVAMVLVVGAALMVQGLMRLNAVSPGFQKENTLIVRTQLTWSRYRDWSRVIGSFSELLADLERIPGVQSVAGTSRLPLGGWYYRLGYRLKNQPSASPVEEPRVIYDEVTPRFFRTVGIPLLKGRDFTESDTEGRPCVTIVNDEFARGHFLAEDPLGRQIEFTGAKPFGCEIVGVVGSVRDEGLHAPAVPVVYFPWAQWSSVYMILLIRTTSDPMPLVPAVRVTIRNHDPGAPLYKLSTLEQLVAESMWDRRFMTLVLGSMAGLALFLALVGVYGLLQYSVTRQTRELGIRIALGAQRNEVLRLIVGRGLKLGVLGLAIGTAVSLALSRLIASQLYGIRPTDPATYAVVSVLFIGTAVLACYLPARRAARIDPIAALRCE